VARFYWDLVSRLPELLWTSASRWEKIIGVGSLCLSVFGVTAAWPFSPLWGLAPILLFFVYGLLKANYQAFREVKDEKRALERKLEERERRKAVKDLLGNAQEEGESLKQGRKDTFNAEIRYDEEVRMWVNRTYNLINDAFGKAEAQRFISNEGYTEIELLGYEPPPYVYLGSTQRKYLIPPRLKRLHELIPRLHDLDVNPDFDPQNWINRQ
jgi:hypothetical protein